MQRECRTYDSEQLSVPKYEFKIYKRKYTTCAKYHTKRHNYITESIRLLVSDF